MRQHWAASMIRKRSKTTQRREPLYISLGATIAYFRQHRLEITQEELAHLTKRKRATIANIEAGRQRIYVHDLFIFAGVFQIDPCILLKDLKK